MVKDVTVLPAVVSMHSQEKWMGQVPPVMWAKFLSCQAPNAKQVQLAHSGTFLSQGLAREKCSRLLLWKAIRKRSFDSAVSLRQPDPQDLQWWWMCGCVNVAAKQREADREGMQQLLRRVQKCCTINTEPNNMWKRKKYVWKTSTS